MHTAVDQQDKENVAPQPQTPVLKRTRCDTPDSISTCATTPGEAAAGQLCDKPSPDTDVSQRSQPFLERIEAVADTPILPPVYRSGFFLFLPVFAAYASLFGLQHQVKLVYGIADNGSEASHMFGFATSFLYIFNLIFRFMHNIVFGCFGARNRTYIAMGVLACSMGILLLLTSGVLEPKFGYLIAAYALGGVGIGSFECNALGALTFLGHATKKNAMLGIPVGISIILVGAFAVMQAGVPVYAIYGTVIVALCLGVLVLRFVIPIQEAIERSLPPVGGVPSRSVSRLALVDDLRDWRQWLPKMWTLPIATAVDMFCLSTFAPGVLLFIYDKPQIALVSAPFVSNTVMVSRDLFFVVYNIMTMVGGLVGRWYAYRCPRLVHPIYFTGLSAGGGVLIILGCPGHLLGDVGPLLAPFAGLLIFIGDGLIYGMICRSIDEKVPKVHNLAALSCWLFVGDFGSIAGSNLISYIRDWVVV